MFKGKNQRVKRNPQIKRTENPEAVKSASVSKFDLDCGVSCSELETLFRAYRSHLQMLHRAVQVFRNTSIVVGQHTVDRIKAHIIYGANITDIVEI